MLQRNLEYFTLDDFLEWVERQYGGYDYLMIDNCAGARFLRHRLGVHVRVGNSNWSKAYSSRCYPLPDGFDEAVREEPHTFAALTGRLRAAIAKAEGK